MAANDAHAHVTASNGNNYPSDGFGDPQERMSMLRHTFGEHGGVNASVEVSTTFTVMNARTLEDIFKGEKDPEKGRIRL